MRTTICVCDICGARTDTQPIRISRYLTFGNVEYGPVLNGDELELCNKCTYRIHRTIQTMKEKEVLRNVITGRRFGKSKMTFSMFINNLPISQEDKKKIYEEYERLERGEK